MSQLRKPLLGLMAALIALFATVILTSRTGAGHDSAVAERAALGPRA
ncbi:MAG: hypothetical protein JNK30_15370 [Phenylobacterium sp.]|nr:hypothetical protein [Phenylobacterium sp.]MBL8772761.1 hypothetical protein [Phenylobacterium sp.]